MVRYTLADVESFLEAGMSLFGSARLAATPSVNQFLTSDSGGNNDWRTIVATDLASSPNNNQVLSYDGSGLAWVAQTAGGTGDITAVNTNDTSGLAGGVTSGAANLALDFTQLATMQGSHLSNTDLISLYDTRVGGGQRIMTLTGFMAGITDDSTLDSLRLPDSGQGRRNHQREAGERQHRRNQVGYSQ